MSGRDARHSLLAPVVDRFPEEQARIFRLALRDQSFRALCEEYDMARKSYGRLMVSPERAAEVAEYRSLIVELEEEIRSILVSENVRR